MPIVPVRRKKKKPDPDRKKTKTVRKPITTANFDPREVTKSGKFATLSNKDIRDYQKALTRRSVGAEAKKKRAKEAAKKANRSLARMNRASGEAARRSQKRNRRK